MILLELKRRNSGQEEARDFSRGRVAEAFHLGWRSVRHGGQTACGGEGNFPERVGKSQKK